MPKIHNLKTIIDMEINSGILLEYFQLKFKDSTSIILTVGDYRVMEIKMPDGYNIGLGITMDLQKICIYEVDDEVDTNCLANQRRRFKPYAYFDLYEKGILFNCI